MPLETYVTDIIEGRRKASFISALLYIFSLCFRGVVCLRRFLYKIHFLKQKKVSAPVISIGNITAGGTGKTPLIDLFAKEFSEEGILAILSRGYRSGLEASKQPVCIAKGQGPLFSPDICGDEPYLLSLKNPKMHLWIGKNRLESAKAAIHHGADLLFLDDGLQSLELARDIEIIVIDGQDPLGKGFFLPRGYLRDHPENLQTADLIVINHVKNREDFERVKRRLVKYTKAPFVGMHMKGNPLLLNKKVGAFCAIGKPNHFFNTVNELGATLVDTLVASDHLSFTLEALEGFAIKCKNAGAEFLVCTEKDFIKYPKNLKLSLPVKAIEVSLEIVAGEAHLEALKNKIRTLRKL